MGCVVWGEGGGPRSWVHVGGWTAIAGNWQVRQKGKGGKRERKFLQW